MGKITQNWDLGMLLVRLAIGGLCLWLSSQLLLAGPSRWAKTGRAIHALGIDAYPEIWGLLAAVLGVTGALCLICGVLFRPSCLVLTVIMAIAVNSHLAAGESLQGVALLLENGLIFLGLAITGPGRYGFGKA